MSSRNKLAQMISAYFIVNAIFAMVLPTAHAELTQQWEAHYVPSTWAEPRATVVDDAGNVYVTDNRGGIVAYNSSGNQLWDVQANGVGPRKVTTDKDGNVYTTGNINGSENNQDIATIAYDSLGNELWGEIYNGHDNIDDFVSAIATDDTGNVYVTGYSGSYSNGVGGFTIAYNSSGNKLWEANHYGNNVSFNAIAIDMDGNIYVTGSANNNYATVAYNSSGEKLWLAAYNGPGYVTYQGWQDGNDTATAITIDDAGNVYVTGTSLGTTPPNNSPSYDIATVAYNSLGDELWVKRYTGTKNWNQDSAYDVEIKNIEDRDYLYVTGFSRWSEPHPRWLSIFTRPSPVTIIYHPNTGYQYRVINYESNNFDFKHQDNFFVTDSEGNAYVTFDEIDYYSSPPYMSTRHILTFDSYGRQISMTSSTPCYAPSSSSMLKGVAIDNADNVYMFGRCVNQESISTNSYIWENITTKYSQKAPNTPPVADAGADLAGECAGPSGTVVTLDGTGSSDPDGDTLTYNWSGPFGSETGATATVTLPLGTHTIRLTVDDGMGGIATDYVQVKVEDTTPPVVTKAILRGTNLLPGLYLSDVFFEMEAIDSCSGVADVRYVLDGTQSIVSGSSASATISSGGDHTITYEALDNAGNVSVGDSLAFSLFEANASGLSGLTDNFLAQGLISSQMETSLNKQATTGAYGAFINHVEAQIGKKIDPAAAQALIEAAQFIMGN